MSGIDIVVQLRQGVHSARYDDQRMQAAADTIEFLRTEIERLGESLNKCHAKLMGTNCPVVDVRNSKESE